MKISEILTESWSQKYKSSINCSHPKGFSQKAHCAGKKKRNESVELEMTCPDCGMCETHGGTLNEIKKGQKDSNGYTKCWPGKHAEGTKKGKNGKQVRNCVPNESLDVKKKNRQVLGTRDHVNEATDPKFLGFMNKALGDKVDPEPTTTKLPAEYSKFQVMSFDNMPGYKPAFKFGLNVLKAMDQKTRQRFINAPDDDLIVYMLNIADKKGFMPKNFVEEDLDEVTQWFDEIFADPNLHSWTDLLKSMSGKPGVAEASFNKNTTYQHVEVVKIKAGNWIVYIDNHSLIRAAIREIGPRMMYDIIYYVDKIPNLENLVPIGGAFWIQDKKTNSSFYFKRLDIPGEPLAVRCETGIKDVPKAGQRTPVFRGNIYTGPEDPRIVKNMKVQKLISRFVGVDPMAAELARTVQKNPTNSKSQLIITNPEMQDSKRYDRAFLKAKKLKGVAEANLNEFVPPSSNGGGEDERSRRLRKLLEIAIQVAKEKNVDELGMIHAMNMIAGDEFFNVAVEGLLPDITDREYMYVLESAYKTVKKGLSEGYGRYYCSTDKRWKERKGPRQTRK